MEKQNYNFTDVKKYLKGNMKSIISVFVISSIFFGCNNKSSQEYLSEANIKIENQEYKEAVNKFEYIVKEFPESSEAPQALMKLALIYQSRSIENIRVDSSFMKSAFYYGEVFKKYPDSKDAPKALFMSGFINANELHNFTEAKKIYEKFIDIYPNDELASSAKNEIENLGVPAEKIIEKKISKKI